jgi:hypothetical protein
MEVIKSWFNLKLVEFNCRRLNIAYKPRVIRPRHLSSMH